MKVENFDYFLGIRNTRKGKIIDYALVDLTWDSPPELASTIDEAYSLLTGAILDNKTVLLTRVPDILTEKYLSQDSIDKIVSGIRLNEKDNINAIRKKEMIEKIREYSFRVTHNLIPEQILIYMNARYNKDNIKDSIKNPFSYQPSK